MRVKDNQNSIKREHKDQQEKNDYYLLCSLIVACLVLFVLVFVQPETNYHYRKVKLVSLDFNIQQSHRYGRDDSLRSARWDLLIRVPGKLVGKYMCLQGNIQASLLYKNVTLATSSIQSYNKLDAGMPHLLSVSAVASEEDLSGAIGKEIMEAIKEKKKVRFGSRLSLSDCSEETDNGKMSYECDETTLRFEPSGSDDDQIKATAFGKRPVCKISL